MSDLFGGTANARQTDKDQPEGLFRKRYRKLSDEDVKLHDTIKDKAEELAALIQSIDNRLPVITAPACEEGGVVESCVGLSITCLPSVMDHKALAIQHLEDSVYRAVKALTA